MKKENLIFLLLIIILFSCKTAKNDPISKIFSVKNNYNKFEDYYDKFKYTNKNLRFSMTFDTDWIVITNYQSFDSLQKKFAKYFTTDTSEVLFIGFNDKKNIGLRATVEVFGLDNTKYVEKVKEANLSDFTNYKIKIINDKEVILRNIQAYSLSYEAEINSKNIFVFDTVLFKDQKNNFRIDMWTIKNNYDNYKNYINSLFQTIDIIDAANNPIKDSSTDTTTDKNKK